MSYPREIVLRRLKNEIEECREYIIGDVSIDTENTALPFEINMHMTNVLAYSEKGKTIADHDFTIVIGSDYGHSKPEVRWRSKIFHPNIMMPEDGGMVCTKLLDDWTYGTKLIDFLSSISDLISNPNVLSPFGTDSCLEAAEFFKNNAHAKFGIKTVNP